MIKKCFIGLLLASALCLTGCSADTAPETATSEAETALQTTTETLPQTTTTTETTTKTTTKKTTTKATTTKSTTTEAATTTQATTTLPTGFIGQHSVSFSPQDLDTVQLDDFTTEEETSYYSSDEEDRGNYISYLLQNGIPVPVYVGNIVADRQNNCVYVLGLYDWCTKDIEYWCDVAVFRIDEATGAITQCCRQNISKLGHKTGFSLASVGGKLFMESNTGLYLIEDNQFILIDEDYDFQTCTIHANDNRLVLIKPVPIESAYKAGTFEFDFGTNTFVQTNNDILEDQTLLYIDTYTDNTRKVDCEYLIPDNRYARTNFKVEW